MNTRMLIDARHPEETRVAVLKGNRIDEFDFDSADHKQIKGNIYLAKVTRVEPSLQAAFVDFGGNRHGFLAFSEIHPDYYQIPKEDREALLAEEAAHAEEEAALRAVAEGEEDFIGDDELGEGLADDMADGRMDDDGGVTEVDTSEKDEVATIEAGHVEDEFDHAADERDEQNGEQSGRRGRRRQGGGNRAHAKQADELRDKRMALRRRYKIQDVIHRRQVLLVQVVKEERGNKGAALTSYLSLAGRYCVLMPNSSHGGGISRKISSVSDRKRLKSIIAEMDLPKSMGCIVRTAGLSRTKTEIKRDFDYLARLWDDIRENTLGSSAPALIHSDSDLIKRAIRDIYNNDIEDIVVEGEAGYRDARAFMKLLMPSHAKRVKAYADPVPLFQRYGAEDQLSALYDPVVQLKSGGYLVINPTEALVSIDINSGRSTKEHGIEATAVNTNLEAAREIARQLRLRDMAGLVVIDFIDMEYGSNVRKVEKAMKDALKNDRARIQVGRISSFGLMEMSRQRLRTGVLEATTHSCPHCDGTGLVRTAGSAGLSALRSIEDEAAKGRAKKHWEKVCPKGFRDTDKAHAGFPKLQLAQLKDWIGEESLFLYGPTGMGKTRLALLMIRRAMMKNKWVGVLWPEKLRSLTQGFDNTTFDHYAAYDVLLMDDPLLTACRESKLVDAVKMLVDVRMREKRPTIFTSQIGTEEELSDGKEFKEAKAADMERIKATLRRIKDSCKVITFAKAVPADGEAAF